MSNTIYLKIDKQKLTETLSELDDTKSDIDTVIKRRLSIAKIIITSLLVIFGAFSFFIAIKWNVELGIITFTLSIAILIYELWKKQRFNLSILLIKYRKKVYSKQCSLRRYSDEIMQKAVEEKKSIDQQLTEKEIYRSTLLAQLQEEKEKIDEYSIDISLVEP